MLRPRVQLKAKCKNDLSYSLAILPLGSNIDEYSNLFINLGKVMIMEKMALALLGTLICLGILASIPSSAEDEIPLGSSVLRGGPRPVPGPPTYVDDNLYYAPDETYGDTTIDLMSVLDLSEKRSYRELT